jgi:phosphoglycerate dehydrogenase-like enzyme
MIPEVMLATEPLPASCLLWEMDNVLITPHPASVALPA